MAAYPIYNVFLASEGGLEDIRDQIELTLRRKIIYYRSYGFIDDLDIIRWETHSKRFHGKRKQDEYNRIIKKSEIFIAIFFKKANLTKEELLVAYNSFQKGKNPKHILVYFYEPKIDLSAFVENYTNVIELKKWIESKSQVYGSVDSSSTLLSDIRDEVEAIIKEYSSLGPNHKNLSEKPSPIIKNEQVLTNMDEESNATLLFQLNALLINISNTIKHETKLFGRPSPQNIAEMTRLQYEINSLRNKSN
jgi:hypothetical protein